VKSFDLLVIELKKDLNYLEIMTANTLFQLLGNDSSLGEIDSQNNNLQLDFSEVCGNGLINSLEESIPIECKSFFENPNYTFIIDPIKNAVNSSSNKSEKSFQYHQPWEIQLIWSLIFGLMILFAVFGNLIVICIIVTHRSMRTVTNYFLLNLTIADLVTIIFNATFNYIFMLNGHWPFGKIYCVVNNFLTNLTIAVSVFTIMITSIDRYEKYFQIY
jgi:tachykinin-like receptor